MPELVSIVIPTLDEAVRLPIAIRSVDADPAVEVIVADGGSRDATLAVAAECGARVVHAPRSRAGQLAAGAAAARGTVLLFLHADSRLAPGAVDAARVALANPDCVGGAFTLRIGRQRGGLRLISWGTNLRARWLGLPYGDQALFARASVFRAIGGFRAMAIMEDVDLVRRLRRAGRMVLIDLPVATSARRWHRHGLLRTTLANNTALAMFHLGIAPHRIKACYDSLLPAPGSN